MPRARRSEQSVAVTTNNVFEKVLKSVVKIYCTYTKPNFSLPWAKERQQTCTSSGFVIEGRKILGNAHGVAFHSSVRVRKHGDSTKYVAKVVHVGHECDLAMLEVEDEKFWKGLEPLEMGDTPNLQEEVIVVGYPTGGDNVSVTQGIVSRVAIGKYSHGECNLLVVQIDAAVNSGNSGGPALSKSGNKVMGVAFQTLTGAENIGYIIPIPVIQHFLQDISKFGHYKGFCSCSFLWQTIENVSMKKALHLHGALQDRGILVRKVLPLTQVAGQLHAGDVLLSFDNVPIASDGTVEFRQKNKERVAWTYLVTKKFVGDTAEVTVLRQGKQIKRRIELEVGRSLVLPHVYETPPSYFIFGGFVFSSVTCPFLTAEYGVKWDKKAPIDLCEKAFYGIQEVEGQEVVVLNQVLTNTVNIGYEDLSNALVTAVNGVDIVNIKQLMWEVKKPGNTGQFVKFTLARCTQVIINLKDALAQHSTILDDNNIPSDMSQDLQDYYNQQMAECKKGGPPGRTAKAKAKATTKTPTTNTPRSTPTSAKAKPRSPAFSSASNKKRRRSSSSSSKGAPKRAKAASPAPASSKKKNGKKTNK